MSRRSDTVIYDVKGQKTVLKTNGVIGSTLKKMASDKTAAAVAQWVRAFAPQAEGWVFESRRDRPI